MINIILAKTIFFYSFFASAGDISCQGVLNYSETGSKLIMYEGKVIKTMGDERMFWVGDKTVDVDVSETFTTKYERENNYHVQTFNSNDCLGVK